MMLGAERGGREGEGDEEAPERERQFERPFVSQGTRPKVVSKATKAMGRRKSETSLMFAGTPNLRPHKLLSSGFTLLILHRYRRSAQVQILNIPHFRFKDRFPFALQSGARARANAMTKRMNSSDVHNKRVSQLCTPNIRPKLLRNSFSIVQTLSSPNHGVSPKRVL